MAVHVFAQTIVLEDFDSLTLNSSLTNGFGSVTANPGPPVLSVSGANQREVLSRGTGDQYVRLARNFSNTQAVAIGGIYDLSTVGLVTGQEYALQFDYLIDQVGTGAFDTNAEIRYGVFEDDSGYARATSVAVSLNDFTAQVGDGTSELFNYSDSTAITPGASAVAWTTYTSPETFTFSGSVSSAGFLITGLGFGVGNSSSFDDANTAFLGIDNISFVAIPEPSTLALVGLALISLRMVRRRMS